MTLDQKKKELTKRILGLKNNDIINHFNSVLDTQDDAWWDTMPDKIKKQVTEGIGQADRGEGKPHDEVMKKYRRWLGK